jgi:STE24 endopeptidase
MEEKQLSKEEFLKRLERAARSLRRQELALGIMSFCVGLAYLIVMLLWGSIRLESYVTRPVSSQPAIVFWYLLSFTILYHLVHFPISFTRGYVVQKRFRLSTQRFRRWLWSDFKKLMVSAGLIVVLGEGLYYFLRRYPDHWWLLAWCGYVVFGLLANIFGSRLILPLFYKRADLEDGDLRARIEALVRRAGFKVSGVKRIILEKDTRKANAAVVGLGAAKEILVSDTLIANLSPDEIEAVVAHELGHLKRRHAEVLFAVGIFVSFLAFVLAGGILKLSAVQLGLSGIWDVAGFPLIILVMSGLYMAVSPPLNYFSRQMEKTADLWAGRFTHNPLHLASALEKLSATNLAEREQPRYYEIIFSSHPSVSRRIAYLKAAAAVEPGTSVA